MKSSQRLGASAAVVTVLLIALLVATVTCDSRKGVRNAASPLSPTTETKKANEKAPEESSASVTRLGPKAPAVYLTAGLSGYLEPCGCTLDITLGGIDRIAGYMQEAAPLYTSTLYFDAGDLLFGYDSYKAEDIPQEKERIKVIIAGMKKAKLQATIPGRLDLSLGTETYLKALQEIGATPLGANITLAGTPLVPYTTYDLGEAKVVVVGVADPKRFQNVADIEISDPIEALTNVIATIKEKKETGYPILLLSQGELSFTKSILEKFPEIDFGLVGVRPRMTDQVDSAGKGFTLEPYDQGRYLGILSLISSPEHPISASEANLLLTNARQGSQAQRDAYLKRLENIDASISKIPPDPSGKLPPMALSLRKQKKEVQKNIEEMKQNAIKMEGAGPWFLWNPVPMDKGLPSDPELVEKKKAYNDILRLLILSTEREIVPPKKGEPYYVGTDKCVACHKEEKAFWDGTAHAHAVKTLSDIGKEADQSCIGCHVVGYEQPGGSVLGKLVYDLEIPKPGHPNETETIHKDLRNVGCESCHGPGSKHIAIPVNSKGEPQHIRLSALLENDPHHGDKGPKSVCETCHVHEHSPRFDLDKYLKAITGKGHAMRGG